MISMRNNRKRVEYTMTTCMRRIMLKIKNIDMLIIIRLQLFTIRYKNMLMAMHKNPKVNISGYVSILRLLD